MYVKDFLVDWRLQRLELMHFGRWLFLYMDIDNGMNKVQRVITKQNQCNYQTRPDVDFVDGYLDK